MSCQNSYKLAQKLDIAGETTDGKMVLKNSFIFMSTLGLPLNILIEELEQNGFVIDWIDFCTSALKDGWKPTTIFNKIKEGIEETYAKDYQVELLGRLKNLLHIY